MSPDPDREDASAGELPQKDEARRALRASLLGAALGIALALLARRRPDHSR
jgi:hypothetical protein